MESLLNQHEQFITVLHHADGKSQQLIRELNLLDVPVHLNGSNQTVTRDNPGYCYVRINVMGDGVFESGSGVGVIDARPPHTETGLASRAIEGTAPNFPTGLDPVNVARRIIDAVANGETDLPTAAFTT